MVLLQVHRSIGDTSSITSDNWIAMDMPSGRLRCRKEPCRHQKPHTPSIPTRRTKLANNTPNPSKGSVQHQNSLFRAEGQLLQNSNPHTPANSPTSPERPALKQPSPLLGQANAQPLSREKPPHTKPSCFRKRGCHGMCASPGSHRARTASFLQRTCHAGSSPQKHMPAPPLAVGNS